MADKSSSVAPQRQLKIINRFHDFFLELINGIRWISIDSLTKLQTVVLLSIIIFPDLPSGWNYHVK